MAALSRLPPDSRRQQAVQALRRTIVTGQLRPGDRLVEADLARQLGASRGTVREALRQLEQEGLIVSHPYRGTAVLGVSQEEIEEVLVPIRLTLERFAFRRALPRLTAADFVALERLVAAMRVAAAAGDADGLAEADVRFHELVIARAAQPHCAQLWRTIEPRVRAHFRRDAPAHAATRAVPEGHAALLAALRARDADRVLAVLEGHIRDFLRIDPAGAGRGAGT